MAGVLSHINVIEVANVIAGPYTGMLLADLGAQIIKVEPPGTGDLFRAWDHGLYSPSFVAYNRSKRSITINLREPEGLALLMRLAKDADVLLENFRPGVADRLGFGYDVLREINPRLVYCAVSGFGNSGPYVERPAYDGVIQSLSGLMSELTDLQSPRPIGPAFSDHLSGLFAAQGILAALVQREQTGKGQRVLVPMVAATLTFQCGSLARYFMLGELSGPYSRCRVSQTYAFTCADDKALVIHLSSPRKFWMGLLTTVGRTDLDGDARFVNRDARSVHYEELEAILRPIFRQRPRDEWLRDLEANDVPAAPMNTLPEALADPQVRDLELEKEMTWPDGVERFGRLHAVGCPVRFDTPLPDPKAPPPLGADTDAILGELGLGAQEIEALRAKKVI